MLEYHWMEVCLCQGRRQQIQAEQLCAGRLQGLIGISKQKSAEEAWPYPEL